MRQREVDGQTGILNGRHISVLSNLIGLRYGRAIKDLTRIGLSLYYTLKCVASAEDDLCLGVLVRKIYLFERSGDGHNFHVK